MKCERCRAKMKRESVTAARNATRVRYICPRCDFADFDYIDAIISGIVKDKRDGSGYIDDVSQCDFIPCEVHIIE